MTGQTNCECELMWLASNILYALAMPSSIFFFLLQIIHFVSQVYASFAFQWCFMVLYPSSCNVCLVWKSCPSPIPWGNHGLTQIETHSLVFMKGVLFDWLNCTFCSRDKKQWRRRSSIMHWHVRRSPKLDIALSADAQNILL